jgi:hypothetical protein
VVPFNLVSERYFHAVRSSHRLTIGETLEFSVTNWYQYRSDTESSDHNTVQSFDKGSLPLIVVVVLVTATHQTY